MSYYQLLLHSHPSIYLNSINWETISVAMPKTNYNDSSFWQQNYKTTCCEQFQWICKPQYVFTSISDHLDYTSMGQVLEIGCGTSLFSTKLKKQIESRSQQTQITCIDFSKELIKKLRNSRSGTGINYICADVRDMKSLPTQQYDYIFDKGCLDCLFCHQNFIKEVIKALRQCFKLLKPGGKLVIISNGKSKNRYYLFRNKLVPFSVTRVVQPKSKDQPQVNFYICQKPQENEDGEQSEGHIDINNQKSEQDIENEKKKEEEEKKKKEKQAEAERKKKEEQKKKGNFILDQGKKKKQKGGDFVLSEDTTDIGGDFILGKNGGQKKKGNEKGTSDFILDEQNQQQQQGQNEQQQDNNENNGNVEDQHNKEQQNAEKEEEEANFILKQAEYENQFEDDS